jgi:hypothetical protein
VTASVASAPVFALADASNATAGFSLTYHGEPSSWSNPYACPRDPVSGQPFSRTTRMHFHCAPDVAGAQLVGISEPAPCNYTLTFVSATACLQ